MELREAVISCYNNDEFVKEYNRIFQKEIKKKRNPIYELVDEQTGKKDEELFLFISFVDRYVFQILNKQNEQNRKARD